MTGASNIGIWLQCWAWANGGIRRRPRVTFSKGREVAQKSSPASATLTLTMWRGEVMVFWEEARGWSARQAPTTITHNSHMFPKELTVVAKTSALISQEFCPSYTLTKSKRKGPLYCEGQRGLERAISPATGPRLSVEVSVSSRASTGQLRCSSATAFPSSTLPSLKHFRCIFWVSFPLNWRFSCFPDMWSKIFN